MTDAATVGVLCFPGSNCEHDVVAALEGLGAAARIVWHSDSDLSGFGGLVVPGGFAHGDYLRPGAIARFSPAMGALSSFAERGGPVLGICNGFQVLTEAGLLPGALMRNAGMRFVCTTVECEVVSSSSVLTAAVPTGTVLRLPVNHYEGNYTVNAEGLAELERNGQVVLRYRDNPNGSTGNIAGVANRAGNVVGLMPHPERASSALLGSADGLRLLESFLAAVANGAGASRAPRVAS
ncbi:MAG: phosphoribosylformylglycinamidine synthase subunit PurQ [Actinomycetota bacterium]|nr:phosphoribosylformylglycinamidine synthase subunit PurQ [Actinomycetota bacterium]